MHRGVEVPDSQTYSHSSSSCARSWLGSAPEKAATRFPSLWNVNIGCAAGRSIRCSPIVIFKCRLWAVHSVTEAKQLVLLLFVRSGVQPSATGGQHHGCHARLCYCSRNVIIVDINTIKLHLSQTKSNKAPPGVRAAACGKGLLLAERRDAHVLELLRELVVQGGYQLAWSEPDMRSVRHFIVLLLQGRK